MAEAQSPMSGDMQTVDLPTKRYLIAMTMKEAEGRFNEEEAQKVCSHACLCEICVFSEMYWLLRSIYVSQC